MFKMILIGLTIKYQPFEQYISNFKDTLFYGKNPLSFEVKNRKKS